MENNPKINAIQSYEKIKFFQHLGALEINEYNLINIGFNRREDSDLLCFVCQHIGYGSSVFKKTSILYVNNHIMLELITEYPNEHGKILCDQQTHKLTTSNINDVLDAIRLFTKTPNQ